MTLSVQAVGSYTRKNAPNPNVVAEYHINLGAKVVDENGAPISGLTAENFVVRVSGIDENILPAFFVTESPSASEFPGFYHLTANYTRANGLFSFDFLLMLGLIVVLKVTKDDVSDSSLIQLVPCIGNT